MHEIEFRGVHSVSKGAIKKVLKTKTKKWWTFWRKPPLLRQDFVRSDSRTIEVFYSRYGYLDASVSYLIEEREDSDRARVVFFIDEGERSYLRSMTFGPEISYPEADLRRVLKLKEGEPFNPVQVPLDRERLLELYADRGYFPIVRGVWTRDSTSIDLAYEITEGPAYHVGKVEISGTEKVHPQVVEREIFLRPGELFRSSQLRRSVERLYGTGLFRVVDFTPGAIDTASAIVDLSVSVRERKHKRIEGGVGISTGDGVRVLGSWSNVNLWRRGHQLQATSSIWFGGQNRFQNRLAYTNPWLFGNNLQGQAGIFFDEQRIMFRVVPLGGEIFDFDERSWGFTLALRRDLTRNTLFTVSLENKWSRAEPTADSFSNTDTIPENVLERFQEQLFTSRFVLVPLFDGRDSKIDPRRGSLYRLVAEFSAQAFGSDGDFQKATVTGAWHLPTHPRSSISLRMQIGRIWPFADAVSSLNDLPATDIYRTGGASSVRGYQEQQIVGSQGVGGLLLLLSNAEYRFPIAWILSGGLFVDGGNVWSRPEDFKLGQLIPPEPGTLLGANDYKWAAGGGLRARSPVGPIRFDLGYRLYEDAVLLGTSRWRFHLSFGQPF